MAIHPRLHATSGFAALLLIASLALGPAFARLPWAAFNGAHFVEAVVKADNYRMRAAALAIKKSPSADVREFARQLWEDSIDDTRRLKWVLTKQNPYVVLPTQVSPHYLFVLDALIPVGRDVFDRHFIEQLAASLSEARSLAEEYARAGDDLDLKEFARASLPKIKIELDRITAIRSQHQALGVAEFELIK